MRRPPLGPTPGVILPLHTIFRSACPVMFGAWSSLLAIAWGLWISVPSMDTFANSPAWAPLLALAPEDFWGLMMCALGLIHLLALGRRWVGARVLVSLVMASWWFGFALLFFVTMPSGVTWITYSFLALGNLWIFLRLAGFLQPAGPPVGVNR